MNMLLDKSASSSQAKPSSISAQPRRSATATAPSSSKAARAPRQWVPTSDNVMRAAPADPNPVDASRVMQMRPSPIPSSVPRRQEEEKKTQALRRDRQLVMAAPEPSVKCAAQKKLLMAASRAAPTARPKGKMGAGRETQRQLAKATARESKAPSEQDTTFANSDDECDWEESEEEEEEEENEEDEDMFYHDSESCSDDARSASGKDAHHVDVQCSRSSMKRRASVTEKHGSASLGPRRRKTKKTRGEAVSKTSPHLHAQPNEPREQATKKADAPQPEWEPVESSDLGKPQGVEENGLGETTSKKTASHADEDGATSKENLDREMQSLGEATSNMEAARTAELRTEANTADALTEKEKSEGEDQS